MSLIAAGGPLAYETSITNMSESGLIVLSICAIILAGFLLIPVMLAGRAPRQKGPANLPPQTGPVDGSSEPFNSERRGALDIFTLQ